MVSRLPDFLVIGGMRCGSTTLYKALSSHPELFLPDTKELHFFDGYNPELGSDLEAYKQLFASAETQQICGEVTPDYLTTPSAFTNIDNAFDQVKLVVILREPVARLCSHYLMSCAAGFEVLPFTEAIQQEKFRLSHRDKIADIFHSYVERSSYLVNLKKYANRFGVENMHVMFLEELSESPAAVLQQLWSFLGVNSLASKNNEPMIQVSNRSADLLQTKHSFFQRYCKSWLIKFGIQKPVKNSIQTIDAVQKQELMHKFQEHNSELSLWLGRELPWQ